MGGVGSEAHGGEGNDSVKVNTGAIGYGGAGNDGLLLEDGSTAVGGDCDDLFRLFGSYYDENGPASITGGEGADTITAHIRDLYGATETVFHEISDFDPSEDVLQVDSFNGALVDNLEIAQNPDDGVTDVRINYAANGDSGPGTAIIRLSGIHDTTEDQIVIV